MIDKTITFSFLLFYFYRIIAVFCQFSFCLSYYNISTFSPSTHFMGSILFSLSPYRGDSVYNYYTASERHPATVLATITALVRCLFIASAQPVSGRQRLSFSVLCVKRGLAGSARASPITERQRQTAIITATKDINYRGISNNTLYSKKTGAVVAPAL